jgi:hypothetical protein
MQHVGNELGRVIESRLDELGWPLARLVGAAGIDAGVVAELVGPAQLAEMPDEETLLALSEALDLPYRELVITAASACGLARSMEGERVYVLRFATNEELLAELRRRLVLGRGAADPTRRRLAHWALAQQALDAEAV